MKRKQSDQSLDNKAVKKHKGNSGIKLPPPTEIIPNYFNPEDVLTDSQLNEKYRGRKRSVKHAPGNWATYLYIPIIIPIPPTNLMETTILRSLHSLIQSIKDKSTPDISFIIQFPEQGLPQIFFDQSNFEVIEKILKTSHSPSPIELHVSLSKLLLLKQGQIMTFVNHLEDLKKFKKFELEFRNFRCLLNEEKTTSFLAATSTNECLGNDYVLSIVDQIDSILDYFQLPKFYEVRILHFCR